MATTSVLEASLEVKKITEIKVNRYTKRLMK